MLRGKDLRQLLAMGWKPTPAQSALIVRRVADALSYAHHKGVIHRDIKPANIFMVGRTQPRVLDFGIARIRQAESLAQRDDPQSRFQEIVGGSPYYMAPEQVQHKPVDRRVDVYALGVVLYELLTFKRAFGGNSLEEIADAVLNKPVPLVHEVNPDAPKVLSEIVARAMHRDPEQRTRSARRLSAELREWLDSVDHQRDVAAFKRSDLASRIGRPGLWTVAAAGWIAALLGVGWLIWQSRAHDMPAHEAVQEVSTTRQAQQPSAPVAVPVHVPVVAVPASVPQVTPQVAEPALAEAPVSAVSASTAAASVGVAAPAAPLVNGTLKLAISPWGEVLVDGRAVGVAPPLHQLSLSPGAHVITIRNGDSPDFRQTIEVRADKVVHVKHQF